MLNALLSGPNPKFNHFIKQIKDDIDFGIGLNNNMSHDELAAAAQAKYNNMVASDEYSKLDPKDAKILSLTTKITALERSVSVNSANVTSSGGSVGEYIGNKGNKIAGVEKWRTVNKAPPSNTRGRQSCVARFINTRTDYLMASTFGTNQKITMRGLRNSRAADLRNI